MELKQRLFLLSFLFLASLVSAKDDEEILITKAIVSPAGNATVVGRASLPAAGLSVKLGGRQVPLATGLPDGIRFTAEASGGSPEFFDTVRYKGKEIARFVLGASAKTKLDLPFPAFALADVNPRFVVSAGRKTGPYSSQIPFGVFEHDDFELRDPAVVLPDGRKLSPIKTFSVRGDLTLDTEFFSPGEVLRLGDGDVAAGAPDPTKTLSLSFEFTVPEESRTGFTLDLGPGFKAGEEALLSFYRNGSLVGRQRTVLEARPEPPPEKQAWKFAPEETTRPVSGGEAKPFTVAWLTDTQYYAESLPWIYKSITQWAAAKYKAGELAYLVVTGDIVDGSKESYQWARANEALGLLDAAGLPYGIAAGNHDVQHDYFQYDAYLAFFGDARFAGRRTAGGSWGEGIHRYDLVSAGSRDLLFLFLGYGFEDDPDALAWADEVLSRHAGRTAVICLHSYLRPDGKRTGPRAETVFRQLVVPHDNVALVLSGHIHGTARTEQRLKTKDGKDRIVWELLSDYQSAPEGGQGFLRLLTFDPAQGDLRVTTYSPYKNRYGFFPADQDEFLVPLSPRQAPVR